jgi:preprotein translocase subunit SecD
MARFIQVVVALALCPTCIAQVSGAEPADKPRVKAEFRWAEEKPTQGLTENKGVDLSCSDQKAYLHKQAILTNQDIVAARLHKANCVPGEKFLIDTSLTREAGKKMARSSAENRNKSLVVLVDGKIVAAMVVKSRLSDFVPITGYFTQAEAERIVKGINRK